MTVGTIQSDKFQLGYKVIGSGAAAIIVGSNLYYSRTFSTDLAKRFCLYFIDHRAYAPASKPVQEDDFSLDKVVSDIELSRVALGVDRMTIIGHSGNGFMALEYARLYPSRVSHVILISTPPNLSADLNDKSEQRFKTEASKLRQEIYNKEISLLSSDAKKHPQEQFKYLLLRTGPRSWLDPFFDAAPLWRDVITHDVGFDLLWGKVFPDFDMKCVAAAISAPVFLALGRHDYINPPIESWKEYQGYFRNIEIVIFEKSGHTPQLEEPERFNEALIRFIQRHQ